jgi:CubicO group peptidase (beta-lactamase class C family)
MLFLGACTYTIQPPPSPPAPAPAPDAQTLVETEAEGIYADPSGLFTVPIPTNWTVEEGAGYATLVSPEEGIHVHVLALPAEDLEEAIDSAWSMVDPSFDLEPEDVVEEPAQRLDRALTIFYDTGDSQQLVAASGQQHQGIAYLQLFQAELASFQRRSAQVGIISTGFTILALEEIELANVEPLPIDETLLADLEGYIEEALQKFNVPGAAVAIVQNDEIVYIEAFGTRDLTTGEPVTPDTQMMIGSTTKTMTTMLMATLVDDGQMEWDTPVVEILPEFRVADPMLTEQITVRNLVCACTGVPRRDLELLFHANELSAGDVIESLETFEFFTDFGEAFQYSNQMVATGGYAAAAAAGGEYGDLYDAYAQAMQERVIDPIGLTNTTLSFEEVVAQEQYATPHGLYLDGQYQPISLEIERLLTPIAPAGLYWSTVEDMARYLLTELNMGVTPEGERVVSAENLQVTWTPQVSVTAESSYGLGWIVDDYKGQRMLQHGGNTFGFTSDLAFLPEANLGIVVLANARISNYFNEAIRYRLLELVFQQEFEADEGFTFAYEQALESSAELLETIVDEVDAEAITSYLGSFTNEALGEITVTLALQEDALLIDAGEFQMTLLPSQNDEDEIEGYVVSNPPLLGAMLRLTDTESGEPVIVLGEGAIEYTFTKLEDTTTEGNTSE